MDGVLASDVDGPSLYAVLRADIYVEPLLAGDAAAFYRVAEILRQALGEHLTWSVTPEAEYSEDEQSRVVPFAEDHLRHIGDAVPLLAGEPADSDIEALAAMIEGTALEDVDVSMKGGTHPTTASPWTVSFWAEVAEVYPDGLFDSPAVLSFTVPRSFGEIAFRDLALQIASTLRVRWASVGYGYASWEYFGGESAVTARRAHALRYVGFDLGFHVFCLGSLMSEIRTVSWCTLVGDSLWSRLADVAHAELLRDFGARRVGSAWLLQASPLPEAGDINRLQLPPGYVALDQLLRPIRMAKGLEGEGWDDRELDRWLCRFERSTKP